MKSKVDFLQDGRGDSFAIMFWGFLGGAIISLVSTLAFEEPVLNMDVRTTLLSVGHGAGIVENLYKAV